MRVEGTATFGWLGEGFLVHQRFIATVGDGRIEGRWEASEDAGATWRKDFDLIFERER